MKSNRPLKKNDKKRSGLSALKGHKELHSTHSQQQEESPFVMVHQPLHHSK